MNLISVDQNKCVKCGICAEICPSCILEISSDGPICSWDRGCMACGHCVAICPTGALENTRTPLSEQEKNPMLAFKSEDIYYFLRQRRSVRNFKKKKISETEITKLFDIARFAPTASNSQGLYYIAVSDDIMIKKITDLTAQWMEEQIAIGTPNSRYFKKILQTYREREIDIIGRNAPHLVFACARKLSATGISNCEQAWAYVELYAPILGLGTTIAGFIQTCGIDNYEPLRELLEIPPKQQIVGTLMLGYPKYKYPRLVERQHLKMEFRS